MLTIRELEVFVVLLFGFVLDVLVYAIVLVGFCCLSLTLLLFIFILLFIMLELDLAVVSN